MKYPVALAMMTSRRDSEKPGVVNFRCMSAVAIVSSHDEAIGVGVRMGQETWPTNDGWAIPHVAVCPITNEQCEQGIELYRQAEAAGVTFTVVKEDRS